MVTKSQDPVEPRYKLTYTVPPSHLQVTKDAIFAAGGGVYEGGKYVQVAFQIPGWGQWMPVAEAGANPYEGTPGKLEKGDLIQVEIMCTGKEVTKNAVEALRKVHPYEVPVIEVFKIEDF